MTAGRDLASAPLARAMLARWSWRPAGVQGTQRLLAGLAARRAPMLEGARGLQAWHDALAHRWRPVDMAPPALTLGATAPVSTGGIGPPAAPDAGAATARGSPEPSGFPMRASSRGRAAPVRISRVSAAASRAQRLPATAPAPARPALTVTAVAASGAISAAPLPVPFRLSTPAASAAADPPPDDRVLVAAIGRRFARREVAGGFTEAASRGTGGAENPAAPPPAPLVRWRVVDSRPAADAQRRAGARLRTNESDSKLETVPALLALRADSPLPAQRTDPILDRRTTGAELVERPGASEAIPPPGLSVRLVPPAEAARRLAVGDDANGRRAEAESTRSEPGARREFPPAPARPAIDIDAIVERVQRELKRREQFERERKGLF